MNTAQIHQIPLQLIDNFIFIVTVLHINLLFILYIFIFLSQFHSVQFTVASHHTDLFCLFKATLISTSTGSLLSFTLTAATSN